MNIKRFVLIVTLFATFTAECMHTSSWWNRPFDFSSFYIENLREKSVAILLGLASAAGIYALWHYWKQGKKETEQSRQSASSVLQEVGEANAAIREKKDDVSERVDINQTSQLDQNKSLLNLGDVSVLDSPVLSSPLHDQPLSVKELSLAGVESITSPVRLASVDRVIQDLDDYLSKRIYVGSSQVEGRSFLPLADVRLVQVKVLNQNLEECGYEKGGGGHSCGYQVIKNSEFIINNLVKDGTDLSRELLSASTIQPLFGLPPKVTGVWRSDIIKERKARGEAVEKGERLEGEEIDRITQKEIAEGKWPNYVGYMIIDDIHKLDENFFTYLYTPETIEQVEEARKGLASQNEQMIYVFMVSTSQHIEERGQMRGTYGHWVTLVLYKAKNTKTRQYIIADSINAIRLYNDPYVKAVIRFMEGDAAANSLFLSNETTLNEMIEAMKQTINEIKQLKWWAPKAALRERLARLQERYTDWSGQQLSSELLEQIGAVLAD